MENYSYNSYPESGDSSPRSRDIDFENPPPWEDSQGNQPPLCYKVKFMCSYGGKIHPRPHDNQLSYIGGETKILSVDRNIKFASLFAKLVALCDNETISFKYQLPGEDLDALISVTNDDDLEHMMHEYERLYRISPKPARLRIFIFPTLNQSLSSARSFGSDDVKSEKERFVEALNSAPIVTSPPQTALPVAPQPLPQPHTKASNVDFLFGLEKANAMAAAASAAAAAQPLAPQPIIGRVPDMEEPVYIPGQDERSVVMDPIQKHIQDLQRLRLEEQHAIYRRKSDENIAGGYAGGEYYKIPEKTAPPPPPVVTGGVSHWPDRQQIQGGMYQANNEPPVYMIPTPAGAYHPPMVRQMAAAPAQGYYAVQRMASDQQPQPQPQQHMYNMMPPSVPSMMPAAPPQQKAAAGYPEGYGMVRAGAGGGMGMVAEAGYAQVAYDVGAGRQVMYAAPGAAAQYQGVTAGALNPEAGGKGALKATQTQASL